MGNGVAQRYAAPSLQDWIGQLDKLRRKGSEWVGPCPMCAAGKDRFHVKQGDTRVLVGCRVCEPRDPSGRDTWFGDLAQRVFGDNGWEPPDPEEQKRREEAEEKRRAEEAKQHARVAVEARDIWETAKPATSEHPYLKRKKIRGELPGLRIADGALLVPMVAYDADGKGQCVNLQRIFSDGNKRPLKGGRVNGTWRAVAVPMGFKDRADKTIYICEGWATAYSIWKATGDLAVIAFWTHGLRTVAKLLRAKYPDARIIVAADNDRWSKEGSTFQNPGVMYAREAAREINAEVAIPDFKDLTGKPTDFDDLRLREGKKAVRKWLDPKQASWAVTAPQALVNEKVDTGSPAPDPGEDGAQLKKKRLLIENTRAGFLEAVKHIDCDLRFNVLADRREWKTSKGWQVATKRVKAHVAGEIREQCSIPAGVDQDGTPKTKPAIFGLRGRFEELSDALFFTREADPFRQWLETLEWDKIPRIDKILHDNGGAPDDELSAWGSRYIFMAACQRTVSPGAKIDEHLAIIGPRGAGKSSFVSQALPPPLREHFRELSLKDDKTAAESLQGCLVAEIGEAHWLTKQDRSWIKNFLTRQDDGSSVRKAYRGDPAPQKRRAAIVITGDKQEILPNDPNLRRFVPVTLAHGWSIEDMYANEREQYWAEAWHRIKNKERANLPRRLMPVAASAAEEHRSRDNALEEVVVKCLEEEIKREGHMKSVDLVTNTRRVLDNIRNNSVIYEAARSAGYELRRVRYSDPDGKRQRCRAWVRCDEGQ